jgi:hypothetical protein
MARKYVLLNFSDYLSPEDAARINTRLTPVEQLKGAFGRRVSVSEGEVKLYNLSDFFGHLRLRSGSAVSGRHPVEGLLDAVTIRNLIPEAAKQQPYWDTLRADCISAHKIVFAAHGHKDDTDNVYCEDGIRGAYRCGTVEGVCTLLIALLTPSGKDNPKIALSVCYAARSADHDKHHVKDSLSEGDIRSSLAFKLFAGLSALKPDTKLRMTARTGATSGATVGDKLLSETEEAIIASEVRKQEFPNAEAIVAQTMRAWGAFEATLTQSNLSAGEQQRVQTNLSEWFSEGCRVDRLDEIINAVDRLDQENKSAGLGLLECLCCCCGVDFSWRGQQADAIRELRRCAASAGRLSELASAAEAKEAKYGKFVYQREGSKILVSRWIDTGSKYRLTALMRVRP